MPVSMKLPVSMRLTVSMMAVAVPMRAVMAVSMPAVSMATMAFHNAGGINISAAAKPAIREILCNVQPSFFRGPLILNALTSG